MNFRPQNMELVLSDNLFPEHLSVVERTKHWIHIFSLFSSLHEKALDTILIQKRRYGYQCTMLERKILEIFTNYSFIFQAAEWNEKLFGFTEEIKGKMQGLSDLIITKGSSSGSFLYRVDEIIISFLFIGHWW